MLAERLLDETVGKKTETGMTLVAAMIAIAEMTVIAGTTETAVARSSRHRSR